jgi:polyhydroxyalkanoate synthesis regulator phasin
MDATGVTDGLRKVFLAGVGAVATVGEKGGQVIGDLAERGETVVRQGRDLNSELTIKGEKATEGVRDDLLRARMLAMTAEERTRFAQEAVELAAELNAAEAPAVPVQEDAPEAAAVPGA